MKEKVYERDGGLCIFCGMPGDPVAHVIARSHSGMGIEQNIVTACPECHRRMDNSIHRKRYVDIAIDYLKRFYPDWTKEQVIFQKWGKKDEKET